MDTPEQFARKSGVLDDACRAVGREPTEIQRLTGQVLLVVARARAVDDDPDIVGGAPFVSERLAAYRDAGVDEFIIRDHADTPFEGAMDSLTSLASDVLPDLVPR